MSGVQNRLSKLASHLIPSTGRSDNSTGPYTHHHNVHTLSPTWFLPRAAEIEPDALAIYHVTANNKILRRTYQEAADRARGFAYYVKKRGFRKVGILCPNTPAFLESIFGIGAAGAINVGMSGRPNAISGLEADLTCLAINYRLKPEDIAYIFDHAQVDVIIVDAEFVHLLDLYRRGHPNIPLIVDTDTDATEGELSGLFDEAVLEGLQHDQQNGNHGWATLEIQAPDELSVLALAYTSGTTARPKGVEYVHRGAYLAALGNVIESGLNIHSGRCRYLWTLPMFHAMGMSSLVH